MPNQKLEELKKVIIEANQSIVVNRKGQLIRFAEGDYFEEKCLRLADVLLAMDSLLRITVAESLLSDNITKWDLRKDDIDHQSQPTISFLHSILCQKT